MLHTSWIELSRSALQKNIRFLKRRVDRNVLFTSVVKGNAYGHGLDVFTRLAEDCGVRNFAVFSANEAEIVLRSRTRKSGIMIMGALDNSQLEWAIENSISFYVFNLERLQRAGEAAIHVGQPARVHIEVETGMHRLGFEQRELKSIAQFIKGNPDRFSVEGVCTHYAGAESVSNFLRIQKQIEVFNETVAQLEGLGIRAKRRHTACSAAVLAYPDTIMDMVRVGIAQYGYWPSKEIEMQLALERRAAGNVRKTDPLKRVITWKSRVMSVKNVAPGEFVGYGTSYLANDPMTIAIVPVGYSTGFTRKLSNTGRVLIQGRRLPVIGMVNMNMMAVDVTQLKCIAPGEEVVLIGKQKKHTITVTSFSEMSQFLNYEMLVRLPSEIPRFVVD